MEKENQPQKPKGAKKLLRGLRNIFIAVGLFIAVIIVWAIATPEENKTLTNNDSQKIANENIEKLGEMIDERTNKNPMKNLEGFNYKEQNTGESVGIYGYNPVGEKDFSVTVMKSEEELTPHDETYILDKNTININDIPVKIGYRDNETYNGIQLWTAYESLAFDFKYQNEYYTGEISNTLGEPSKDKLDEILDNFIGAIVNANQE